MDRERTGARPPTGVRIAWRNNGAGPVKLRPVPEHRVNVHATASTPSSCLTSGFRCVRSHGDVDVTPAGDEGGFVAEAPSRTLEVRIPPGLLERVAEEADRVRAAAGLEARHLIRDGRLAHLAFALDAERRATVPVGSLFVDAIGVAMSVELLGLHARIRNDSVGLSARKLQRVIDFVEANLESSLSLFTLARVAGVSSAHLRHWFKAKMGTSVHRYVVRRRVERARVLLLQRTLPASEIALVTGFAHQTHMARWMRRELGVTPRELLRGASRDADRAT